MKEDYLWNKTGEDAEIEKLENALSAFRYKETAPPALPAKIIPFKKESEIAPLLQKRGNSRFAFALAACIAFVFFGLAIWLQISKNNIETNVETAKTISIENKIEYKSEIQPEIPVGDFPVSTVKTAESPKTNFQPRAVKIKTVVPIKARTNKNFAKNLIAKNQPVKLSREEQYAYDQLMLALSITSSKLKIVKNKVDGIEEQTASVGDEK